MLDSVWVKKDFEDLGVHYPVGLLPPVHIIRGILRSMKNGFTPLEIAEWFSQTNLKTDNHNNGE